MGHGEGPPLVSYHQSFKGLGVGKFNFVTGPDGKTQVVNDYGNKSLFVGLPSTSKVTKALSTGGVTSGAQSGPLDYGSFKMMFQELDRNDQEPERTEQVPELKE